MYLILKENVLKDIVNLALKEAGDIRNLSKKISIPRSTLSDYHMEKRSITDINLKRLIEFTQYNIKKEDVLKELPNNFRQKIGGIKCVKRKKERGVFDEQLKLCQKGSSEYMKKWHKIMKRENPEEYYKSQYEKFKLVSNYKLKKKKGEKVRNKLEKEVADILKEMNIEYKYEPLVKSKNKYFFPDFLIKNKIIIECTMWRGTDKAIKLKEKIEYLKENYKVYIIIPKHLNNYYQILDNHLIKGLDEFVPVAQTF